MLLKPTANLSTGGTSTDVTDEVHPANIIMCERIAKIIGLDICGIDIMATDLRTPITENGGAILEVNAAPGFRMHIEPSVGLPAMWLNLWWTCSSPKEAWARSPS